MSKRKHTQLRVEKKIQEIFLSRPTKKLNYKQIASLLNVTDTKGRNEIIRSLGRLSNKKVIKNESRGLYQLLQRAQKTAEAKFILLPNSKGSVYLDEEEIYIKINKKNFGLALHGDTVEISYERNRRKEEWEGRILRVLERNKREYVGILDKHKDFAFVLTRNIRMHADFFIPKTNAKKYKDGEKVVVVFDNWQQGEDSPTGKIVKTLGIPGEQETEIHAILHEYGLPYSFTPGVEKEAEEIETSIKREEIKKRRDFRRKLTFTIDPVTAKDFDDALSFEILSNASYEIGIHIADVSHYVRPGSSLEEEAYNRATSVYLVDRVIPMLPEKLSNGVCSLRPKEEKLTMSAVFEITPSGKIVSKWFGKTVILSNHRFSYEEVQDLLESNSPVVSQETSLKKVAYTISSEMFEALNTLDSLAQKIRKKRFDNGALSFDRQEVNFTLDNDNQPVGVHFKESKRAHQLVEEFMLLANRNVAEMIGKRKEKLPFVYRIHDEPDPDKLDSLREFVQRFGYTFNVEKKNIAKSINSLLTKSSGKKEQHIIDTLALRAMSKAIYTTQNIGHYGLAFSHYTHFTSPIRRYSDVLVHRLLIQYQNEPKQGTAQDLDAACQHASNREQLATKAERDSIKYMQVVYMQNQIGKSYDGVISGVTERGIFVELNENKCEGMIRVVDIEGDYFVFLEKDFALVGQRTKKVFELGDPITIRVKKADVIKRHLDFVLA